MADAPTYYAHLTFNAPLSGARADAIATRLAVNGPSDVLDVGCGWGELLLRVTAAAGAARGLGVDTDTRLLERAREAARSRGLDDRLTFAAQDGATVTTPADVVLCVGSSHAFGEDAGLEAALAALYALVRPGGRLLLGEHLWEPTGPVDTDLVWDDVLAAPDLAGLVDAAVAAGFRPLWIEQANRDEWDAFESGFLADEEEWLVRHPTDPAAADRRTGADEHRVRWLRGYRHGLGFAYLTLGRPA